VARFRPQNKVEIASGGEPIVDFNSEDTCTIQVCRSHSVERSAAG
jgi:kinesin family protein 5